MAIRELFCYPTNLMYARCSSDKEPQESYHVTSVIALDPNKKISGLFWKIVRESDNASQYVNFSSEPNTTLFFDPECVYPYDITISDQWIIQEQV